MEKSMVLRRPSWSVVVLLLALAALLSTVLALRNAPRAAVGGAGQYELLAAGGSGVHVVDRVKLSVGDSATLFKNASFKVVAKCVDAGAGVVTAEYGVRALVKNSLVFGTDSGNETDTRLDPADGLFHYTSYEASSATKLFYGYDYYQEFTAESPAGQVLIGRVSNGVHMRGADCIYDGLFVD
jgi:hypothetical protein